MCALSDISVWGLEAALSTENLEKVHERSFEGICMSMTVTYLVSTVKDFLPNWETAGGVLSFFDCLYRNSDLVNRIGKNTYREIGKGREKLNSIFLPQAMWISDFYTI